MAGVVTIYACTQCGTELGRGPMTMIGSPFVKCQCGKETLVPNRNEWDLMKPSTQSELASGPYWIGFGAALPIAGAGFAIWAGIAGMCH